MARRHRRNPRLGPTATLPLLHGADPLEANAAVENVEAVNDVVEASGPEANELVGAAAVVASAAAVDSAVLGKSKLSR